MFNSLRSKILIALVMVVSLTTFTQQFFFLYKAKEQNADLQTTQTRQLLDSVYLTVENQYKSLLFYKEASLEKRKNELKNIIDLGMVNIDFFYSKVVSGDLNEEDAKRQAIESIKRMRFNDDVGYIWLNDMGEPIPKMIMHPTIPALDGQILDDPKFNCAQGIKKNLFVAFVEVCFAAGQGYVDYLWPKPTQKGLTAEQPKLSYVRLFEPWGWVVGTGIYIDDLEKDMQERLDAILLDLDQSFSKIKLGKSGYMFLFTGGNKMLIHPVLARSDVTGLVNPESGNPILQDLMLAAKSSENVLRYKWDKLPLNQGQYKFKTRSQVVYFPQLDWYIASTVYNDEFEEPAREILRSMSLLATCTLVFTVLLSLILSKNLSRPLRKLTAAAKTIKDVGIDEASVPVTGTKETRYLGEILNTMLKSISDAARVKEDHFKSDLAIVNSDLRKSNENLQKEIEERKHAEETKFKLERQLHQAEKMEAVGRLAAGIAHEINTPTQFVSTNIAFLEDITHDLDTLLIDVGRLVEGAKSHLITDELIENIELNLKEADWDYLREEIPTALKQSQEGLGRIASIVLAMKNFSHPGGENPESADINLGIESTVTVTKNEWKFIADIELQLDKKMPYVLCFPNELNQVFLNLIMNSIYAINETLEGDTNKKGLITITSKNKPDCVEIIFADNGTGIPEDIIAKVFEPFFTTKEVGKGTGQGLAIVHDIIVNKHKGSLDIQSEVGRGTTIVITLSPA